MVIAIEQAQMQSNVEFMPNKSTSLIVSDEAKEQLINESFETAYRVAYRLLGHRESAQDIAIEAISKMIEKGVQYESFAPSYAAKVSSRLVISSWRRSAIVKKYAPIFSNREDQQGAGEIHSELRMDLRNAIKKLSSRQREVVVLRYLADLTEQDVANFLNISVSTVKSTAKDALLRLKEMVEVTP